MKSTQTTKTATASQKTPLERLRYHVSGAIERGEATAIVEQGRDGLAHAEALAEALRDCIASLDWAKAIITDIPEQSSFNQGLTEAREALARWEAK